MAKREFDALDRIVMAFDEPDPIEQIKQAMKSGQIKEASAMVNSLTAEQIDKLALELTTVGPPDNSTPGGEEEQPAEHTIGAQSLESSANPKPETGSVPPGEGGAESPSLADGGLSEGSPDNSVSEVEKHAAAIYRENYLKGARKALTKIAGLAARKNASRSVNDVYNDLVKLLSQ